MILHIYLYARHIHYNQVRLQSIGMCILLLATNNPRYHSVLLNNRDEFLNRPTAQASFWHNDSILSSTDLARPEHGSWLGISRSGRLASLTNYRESAHILSHTSRGSLVTDFLISDHDTEQWVQAVQASTADIGGFNLLCGQLKRDASKQKLACFSNRASTVVCSTQSSGLLKSPPSNPVDNSSGHCLQYSVGLSNSLFSDPWPKVQSGTLLLNDIVSRSLAENWTHERFLQECFSILSLDNLCHSIYIPPLSVPSQYLGSQSDQVASSPLLYGTRTQTVILVDYDGHVTFVERNLWYEDGSPVPPEERDREFTFLIQDW
ncbi:Transport and Golgi organization protein 2 [Neolecta irregularis DAH-3]|uniref:Transport and Golgi organization protein 2 n=1 Tax=Neolecta irregularis (strain DAH-3) TaxID=1198029 RepID=A0A1U7LUR2_NEOID|nr:Transport and Golgi organization protein 2 [Neolecta irregularis DAH-3]|eukprot:OLL26282.1 Transport and Golgi organization protein 2 [Neolecta irregularis DAH-3]